jgi:hypothetical protein
MRRPSVSFIVGEGPNVSALDHEGGAIMITDITDTADVRPTARREPSGSHSPDGSTATTVRHVDRRGAGAAFGFAVLFVVGMLFVASTPEYTVSDGEYQDWFREGANRAGQIVGVVALVLAGLFFLPLVRAVADWVRRSPNPVERTLDLVLASIFTTLVIVGALVTGHGSVAVEIGDTPLPSADVVRSGEQIGYGLVLFAASLVAAWVIGRLALTARRARSAPTWYVALSAVTAVAMVFGALFLPVVMLPIWAVVTGLVLLRPRGAATRS